VKASQVRMARAAVRWSLETAAAKAGLHRNTLYSLENGRTLGDERTLTMIRKALEAEGIEFLDDNGNGSGVRYKDYENERGGN
jgi:transcriptional regulator with XRE-family HTH domain